MVKLYFVVIVLAVLGIRHFTVGAEVEDTLLHRIKRYLVWDTRGIVKTLIGIRVPVVFGDSSKRSLNLGYNIQSQYYITQGVNPIFDAPLLTGFARKGRNVDVEPDDSRKFFYGTLEMFWHRKGRNGRECILRAVCEIADNSFGHNGLIGEIVDYVFTPGEDLDDPELIQARQAGLAGANCLQIYSECPHGHGFLDSISYFID